MVDQLVAAGGHGPWPLAEVIAAGWTPRQVRRAVDAGRLVRPRRGLVAVPTAAGDERDHLLRRVAAAQAVCDDRLVVSHESAALLHGQWLPRLPASMLHVTIPGQADRVDREIRVHGSALPESLVEVVDGVRVTSPARTAMDLGRGGSFESALIAVEGAARHLALRSGQVTERQLRHLAARDRARDLVQPVLLEAFESVWTWPGTVVLRAALDHGRLGAESPFESRSRAWMLLGRLPAPEVAYCVVGASGSVYWSDFAWPDRRVLGEADGTGKYGGSDGEVRAALRAERVRQRDLEDAGWSFVRWDSTEERRRVMRRLHDVLGVESLPEVTARDLLRGHFGQ
jgi:hypothetical protein